jgi:O-antigen/teichoic acid export membrane protein
VRPAFLVRSTSGATAPTAVVTTPAPVGDLLTPAGGGGLRLRGVVARLSGANAAFMAVSLITGPLLARSLGPSGRGALAAVAVPVSLGPILLGLGLPAFVTREAARGEPNENLLGTVGLVYLLVGALAAVAAVPVAAYFAQGREPVRVALTIAMLAMPVLLWGQLLLGLANGRQRWRMVLGARLAPAAVALLGTTALFALGRLHLAQAAALVLLGTFASIVPTLGILRGMGRPRVRRRLLRSSLRFGLPAWLWQAGTLTNARLDQLLMVSLTSPSQLGLYAVAASIASVPSVFAGALGPALLPRVAQGEEALIGRVCRVSLLVAALGGAVLAALCPLVLPLLFGASFAAAVPMALVLIAASVPNAGTQVLTSALLAADRPRIVAVAEGVSVAITVVGLLLLIGPLGGLGAALVSAGAYTVTFAILLWGARLRFELSWRELLVARREECDPRPWLRRRRGLARAFEGAGGAP